VKIVGNPKDDPKNSKKLDGMYESKLEKWIEIGIEKPVEA